MFHGWTGWEVLWNCSRYSEIRILLEASIHQWLPLTMWSKFCKEKPGTWGSQFVHTRPTQMLLWGRSRGEQLQIFVKKGKFSNILFQNLARLFKWKEMRRRIRKIFADILNHFSAALLLKIFPGRAVSYQRSFSSSHSNHFDQQLRFQASPLPPGQQVQGRSKWKGFSSMLFTFHSYLHIIWIFGFSSMLFTHIWIKHCLSTILLREDKLLRRKLFAVTFFFSSHSSYSSHTTWAPPPPSREELGGPTHTDRVLVSSQLGAGGSCGLQNTSNRLNFDSKTPQNPE